MLLLPPSFTPGPGRPPLTEGPRAQLWPQLPIGPWGEGQKVGALSSRWPLFWSVTFPR